MCLHRCIVALCVCAVGLTIAPPRAVGGPLDPPAGAVAPTGKTLLEVEPRTAVSAANTPGDDDSLFKITQPGSYYLTGNITGVANKHGIEIASSNVTLDLSGFAVSGVPGGGFFSGITVSGIGLESIAVVNGSVRGWEGEGGLDLLGVFGSTNCRVEGVLASENTRVGILLSSGCTVTNCSATDNGSEGIFVLSGSVVSGCTAIMNGTSGIRVGTGCIVTDCSSRQNNGDGIRCAFECMIRDNVCAGNGNSGSGAGVHAIGGDNRIEGNNCTGADRGVDVDVAGNIIVSNTCANNATNWDIAANNFYGPIVNRVGSLTAAVSGSGSVASTMGSVDPFANFSY
jgi:parallel beta-helix repeat protein